MKSIKKMAVPVALALLLVFALSSTALASTSQSYDGSCNQYVFTTTRVQRTSSSMDWGYDNNTSSYYDGWGGTYYTSRLYHGDNKAMDYLEMESGRHRGSSLWSPYNGTNLSYLFKLKIANEHSGNRLHVTGRYGVTY